MPLTLQNAPSPPPSLPPHPALLSLRPLTPHPALLSLPHLPSLPAPRLQVAGIIIDSGPCKLTDKLAARYEQCGSDAACMYASLKHLLPHQSFAWRAPSNLPPPLLRSPRGTFRAVVAAITGLPVDAVGPPPPSSSSSSSSSPPTGGGLASVLLPPAEAFFRFWLNRRGCKLREEEVLDAWYYRAPTCPQVRGGSTSNFILLAWPR